MLRNRPLTTVSRLVALTTMVAVTMACQTSPAQAQDFEPLAIGSACPAWSNLPGTDGKEHSLSELKGSKGILVLFFANHCPDCELYTPRILQIAKSNQSKGIRTVLVSVSLEPEDNLEHMTAFAKENQLAGLFLQDKSQQLGKDFGATVTPEAFLFDASNKLVYRGAVDNHWKAEKVTVPYLQKAIDELLAGQKIAEPVGEATAGCTINYE